MDRNMKFELIKKLGLKVHDLMDQGSTHAHWITAADLEKLLSGLTEVYGDEDKILWTETKCDLDLKAKLILIEELKPVAEEKITAVGYAPNFALGEVRELLRECRETLDWIRNPEYFNQSCMPKVKAAIKKIDDSGVLTDEMWDWKIVADKVEDILK
jgi:hypothetical protein